MDAIMLAVAVHDEQEGHLEPAVPDTIRVEAGQPLRFRISYRLADNVKVREGARILAQVDVDGMGPWEAEVTMRDRPLLDDSRSGDLVFDLPPLQKGAHAMVYRVHMETQDQEPRAAVPRVGASDLAGNVTVEAI